MKVGFIGLGAMGKGMVRNLAKTGLLHGVYNRTAATATALAAELNVPAYPEVEQLAAQCNVILMCVSADSDVLELIEALSPHLNSASIIVDLSTISCHTAQQAAEMLRRINCEFLDAPVSGGVEGARHGTLAMMVGGHEKTLEAIKPVLEALAARIIHMGPCGAGQATKAVNQMMAAGINQAVCNALALAQKQHLPMEKVIDVIAGGAAGNWFLQHRGPTLIKGHYTPGFKVALHHKDLLICQQMAQQYGIDDTLIQQTVKDYGELIDNGFGDEDISALYRLKNT